jgi:hypothetical protein
MLSGLNAAREPPSPRRVGAERNPSRDHVHPPLGRRVLQPCGDPGRLRLHGRWLCLLARHRQAPDPGRPESRHQNASAADELTTSGGSYKQRWLLPYRCRVNTPYRPSWGTVVEDTPSCGAIWSPVSMRRWQLTSEGAGPGGLPREYTPVDRTASQSPRAPAPDAAGAGGDRIGGRHRRRLLGCETRQVVARRVGLLAPVQAVGKERLPVHEEGRRAGK